MNLKRVSAAVFLTTILAMSSCVDKDYDLSNVSTDDVTIGRAFIVPVGVISFDFTASIPDLAGIGTVTGIGIVVPPLPSMTPVTFSLDGSIDPDLVSTLTDNGTVSMQVQITNRVGVDVFMTMNFVSDGVETELFGNQRIKGSTGSAASAAGFTEFRTNELDAVKLDKFARATQVRIYVHTEDSFNLTLNNAAIDIKLNLIQEGGLTL